MSCRDDAVRLLDHYLTTTMKKAGLKVDSDTHVEIEECVDQLINAAVEETKRQLLVDLRSNNQRLNP